MALGKEYELVFLLRAQMDASMKQFSLVGGQIKELEQKIQQYNNTLKDIGAYRQQTSAIENYEKKLRDQETALAEVTQKFSAATAEVKTAEQAYRQHQEAIDALNLKKAEQGKLTQEQTVKLVQERQALKESRTALNEAKQAERELLEQKNQAQAAVDRLREKLGKERDKLRELSEALKKVGVDTKNLEAAEESLNRQLQEATGEQAGVTQFADRVNGLADSFTVLKMAASGIQSALEPVMTFYKESLDAAAKLEYGMSSVQAVSGATQRETKELTAVVKEMGATTIYTAEESAKAMQNMALAGWDAKQMISGLPAVIKLAAASGEDLAEMTSIVSDGMNAFQLSGEAAAVKFADVLAKAATSSNTNVSLLGQSLSYVETTAGNLGYSIEDVSLALAAMANNALKGGVSGAALNTILTRMSGANSTAANQMEAMGLSMYYTADAMGHTRGEAKDLKTFLDEVRKAFRSFGDDAQAAQIAAYNLAGMRGMRGLLAIVNQSDEQWQKLTADVYDYAGAADEISSIRMDNYTGQMYLLTSAWDALKTSVGEQFLPTATDALGVMTDITNGANEFVQDHGNIVQGIGAITATTMLLTTGISALAVVVEGARFALTALSATKLMTLMGGFGGVLALAAVAGIAVAGYTATQAEYDRAARAMSEQARETNKVLKDSGKTYEASAAQTAAAAGSARDYLDRLEELERAQGASGEAGREYHNTLVLLSRAMPELAGGIDLTKDSIQGGTQALREQVAAWEESARVQAQQEYLNSLYDQYNNVAVEAEENSYKLTQAQMDLTRAQEKREKVLERMRQLEAEDPNYGGGYFDTDVDAIRNMSEEYQQLREQMSGCDEEVRKANRLIDTITEAMGLDEEQKEALLQKIQDIEQAQKEANEEEVRAEMEARGVRAMTIQQYEDITESVEALADAYVEAYSEAYAAYSGIFGLFEKVEQKEDTTMEALTEALQSQTEYFRSYSDNLALVTKAAEENGIDLSGVWGRLTDGSQDSAAAVKAMADSLKNGDPAKLQEYVEAYDELREKMKALSIFVTQRNDGVIEAVEQMGEDIAQAVRETQASQEAYNAMEATIQSYLDAIKDNAGRVDEALLAEVNRWKAIIADNLGGGNIAVVLPRGNDNATVKAYASGTDSARRGWSLVGENGPELMWMAGGERVLPTEQTRRILDTAAGRQAIEEAGADGAIDVNLNMSFAVSDNATPETVRALRDYGDDIEARVERVLRRMGREVKRRSFT